jgi:hypothetical protein
MSKLRKPNDVAAYSPHHADLELANADPSIQRIIEASLRMDAEDEAAADARREQAIRTSEEISRESGLLAQMRKSLGEPGHTKASKAKLEKQIAMQAGKIDRLNRQSAESKANRKYSPARMNTSRMLAVIASKAGQRPHRLKEIEIPKAYAGPDGLALVREHIAELHAREAVLYSAYCTRDEAKRRMHAKIRQKAKGADALPLAETSVVRRHADGSMYFADFDMPSGAWWDAVLPMVVAYYDVRIDRHYDKLEEGFEAEFISLEDRRREQRELVAKCRELELIEGALIRKAALAGHEVIARPDMDAKNLIPLEVDPDAEWEEPSPQFVEVGAGSHRFAQLVN